MTHFIAPFLNSPKPRKRLFKKHPALCRVPNYKYNMSESFALYPPVFEESQSTIITECTTMILGNRQSYTFYAGTNYIAAVLHVIITNDYSSSATIPSSIVTTPNISASSILPNRVIYSINPPSTASAFANYTCTNTGISVDMANSIGVFVFVVYKSAA